MEQLNNNVIGEFFEKLGILEENDRDEFFKKIDEKHKVNLTQDLDLAVALRKDKGNGKIYTVKNKDLETTMDFAGYYYDLYRQFFAWFIDFKNSYDKNLDGKKVLDLGCDNGITTCFVANLYPNSEIIGVDKCKKGIKCAEEIAQKLGVKNVKFEAVDAKKVDKFFKEEKFDLIVSNPPYIRKADIDGLDRQVKDFEPYNALEGGEDGLDFYRKITEESKYFLKNKGILAYEVGHDQASDVIQIMKENGFESIYTKCDLQGFERVVIGFYNN